VEDANANCPQILSCLKHQNTQFQATNSISSGRRGISPRHTPSHGLQPSHLDRPLRAKNSSRIHSHDHSQRSFTPDALRHVASLSPHYAAIRRSVYRIMRHTLTCVKTQDNERRARHRNATQRIRRERICAVPLKYNLSVKSNRNV